MKFLNIKYIYILLKFYIFCIKKRSKLYTTLPSVKNEDKFDSIIKKNKIYYLVLKLTIFYTTLSMRSGSLIWIKYLLKIA